MRVFLDTNVLVSACTARGLCSDLLREVRIHEDLLICSPLLDEVKSTLFDKIKLPGELIEEIVQFLRQDTLLIENYSDVKIDIKDKDDVILIGYARKGKADYFITGDKELQNLIKVNSLRILSPREYWELIRIKE